MEMTPSQVTAPIGKQVQFTCKYWSKTSEELKIMINGLSIYDIHEMRNADGARVTFYHVVSCYQQTITCVVLNQYNTTRGLITVLVQPGLR